MNPSAVSEDSGGGSRFSSFLRGNSEWLALLLILLVVALIRYRLLGIPFDRDEGGYAYGGRLLLEGKRTFTDFYTMRYPAIFGVYALIMAVFGQTHTAVHGALLVVSVANIVFVFLLARRLFGPAVALLTAAFFSMLSLGSYTEAFSANCEQFVSLFAAAGLWHLVRTLERGREVPVLASGVLLGLAFLMKQQGALFIAFGGAYLLFHEFRTKTGPRAALRIGLYTAGAAIPFLITCALMAATGRFDAFVFWTWTYASTYAASTPLSMGLEIFLYRFPLVAVPMLVIWVFALAGLGAVWREKTREHAAFCVAFVVFSFLATCVGLYFRSHYFRLLFPAVALSAGVGAAALADLAAKERFRMAAAVAIGAAALAYSFVYEWEVFFRMTPTEVSRKTNGLNPFPESLEIAEYLREVTEPGEPIAVIGSEPQIYFYSERAAVTPHLYTYQMMEPHPYARSMQEELIADVESAKPGYVVVAFMPTSWLVHEDADLYIFDWMEAFLAEYHERVGLIEIVSPTETRYYWDEEAAGREPGSRLHLGVYRRKPDAAPLEEAQ